jgi:Domain of unknown function (DUF305)
VRPGYGYTSGEQTRSSREENVKFKLPSRFVGMVNSEAPKREVPIKVKKESRWLALPLVVVPLVVGASTAHNPSQQSPKTGPAAAWSELMGSMDEMESAMSRAKTSGSSDVDFVNVMMPHHQAAIDMAKTELLYGKDPQIRRLAQEIVTDQQSEMEFMKLWLKQRDNPPIKPVAASEIH